MCGRKYDCGIHACERVCHSGDCGPCPKSRTHLFTYVVAIFDPAPDFQFLARATVAKFQFTLRAQRQLMKAAETPVKSYSLVVRLRALFLSLLSLRAHSKGIHKCAERCHSGPCPPCRQFRLKRCRCGRMEKNAQCSQGA